jgi:AraC-like DNA-binding protein
VSRDPPLFSRPASASGSLERDPGGQRRLLTDMPVLVPGSMRITNVRCAQRMRQTRARHTIRRIPFVAPLPLGMEVMTFEQLWTMAPPGVLSRPLRSDFHSLLLVTSGETTHTVDFDTHWLQPGSALWVRPGQVQQFGKDRPVGDLVLFQADFLLPGTQAAAIADDRFALVAADGSPVSSSVDRLRRVLRREYANVARSRLPTPGQTETLQHVISALILRLDYSHVARTDPAGLDLRFRDLLERDFSTARDVDHYTRQLGYSQRTLTRATQAAAGESPKKAINRRVALEAQRLLAHTDRPIASIARELGFNDPSNFAAFFAQQTNETPTGFRRRTGGS